MKLFFILALTTFVGAHSHAQLPSASPTPAGIHGTFSAETQDRFLLTGTTRESLQDNLTLRATVDLNGVIEIHSLVQTGNTYNLAYNTAYDLKSDSFPSLDKATQLYVKQLYFKKMMASGHLALSAGAMDTGDSIALANAMSSIGWIDGAKAQLTSSLGTMTLTAGHIKASDPNAFNRFHDFTVNYIEVTFKRQVLEDLLAEVGAERYEGKNYLEAATKYDLEIAANKVLHLAGEAKIETDNGAFKVAGGVQDILSLFSSHTSQIKLSVNYEYVSKSYSTDMRGLSTAIHTGYTGGAVVTSVQYPISKRFGLSGFTNVRVGNSASDLRIETGFKKSIFTRDFRRKSHSPAN
jgi:hypothetical protein